jgi:hypothetical protein
MKYNQKTVHLIDTPGFDDTYKTDSDVLRDLAFWLTASYGNGFKLTGIIYLHPITHTRMSGSAFKNLRTFRKICGKDSMSSVILATTMWCDVTPDAGDVRETDLKNTAEFWGDMIAEGSKVQRHTNDHHSAMNIIAHLVDKNSTTTLALQKEMVEQKLKLDDTEAGKEVDSTMEEDRKRWQERLDETENDMKEAIAANDKKHIEEVAKEQERFSQKINDIEKGREELKRSMEALIQEKEEQHRQEMEELERQLNEHKEDVEKQKLAFQEAEENHRRERIIEDKKKVALEKELDQEKQAGAEAASIALLLAWNKSTRKLCFRSL